MLKTLRMLTSALHRILTASPSAGHAGGLRFRPSVDLILIALLSFTDKFTIADDSSRISASLAL